MKVYRITLEKYSHSLFASGNPARWNGRDVKMIYTAGSRSLACLENVVHRSSIGLQQLFCVMVILIPDHLPITTISTTDLPTNWREFEQMYFTRKLGSDWIAENKTAVLRVPSAIIYDEYNYLVNPQHSDFNLIELLRVEPFEFDSRIKE